MGGFAWVTLATNDSYSLGALVLAHSLRRVNTSHQLAVLITPAVSQSMKEQLQTVFDVVKVVDVLDSKDETNLALLKRPELGVTFTKIHCWKLTEFEKCVFLDADTLVVRNCDELFEREELSAAPDVGWPDCFNTGVFVYKPAIETFNNLVKLAVEQGSFDGGDQGLLNQYFSDWATSDIKKHLPFVYNLTSVAVYSYIPAFKHYGSQIRIVHFIGAIKPWLAELDPATRTISPAPGSEHLTPLLQNWWDIFVEKVHPAMSKELECASGMLNLQEPACSNSIALETSDQPGIPEPYKPYTEKDDSRQINLPYHPYEVTSSSGESLTAQFLQIREQEILEKQRREQEWWEEEQRRIQEEQKRVQEEKEREEKERQEQSGINEQSDDKHDDEPEPQTEMKEPEQHNEPEHHEQHHHEVHHSHFDYNTFYPDESCINTYLDQNAAFYQPFDSHHKSFEPLPVNNENPFQPEPEQTSHTLPRFLTIPEDDQRQSFHVQEWHPPPPPPQEEHHHQEWHYVPPSIPAPCYQMSTSHENLHVEENAAEVDLQKSKSMTNLAEATGNAMTGNFWKSQPNVNVDANKKYVMPKLKPLLPKVVSTPQPPTPVYEARPKITQYTEFHMSSDYKDPVKLPSDNMGFVERQILKEKRTKINKDAQVSKKFGALPYIEPMEPYVPQQTPPKQKTPLKEIDFNDVIDYDLSSCVRQSGNKPLPQEKKLKKENTLVYLPDLKPLVPADDKREQFKKRKSDERLQVPEDGRRKKRDSRKARERKRKEEVRKPVVTEVYKHTTDVQEILKRLMNYTKDYQDYFKEPEEKVDKRKTPSPTILINGKELEGGFSPIEAYPPADFENGFDESIFVSDFMKTSSGFKGGKDEIKKPKAIKAKKVKRGVEGLVGSEEIVEESIVRDAGRGTKAEEVESREETIEEEVRIGKVSAGMLEAGISVEKEQEITQSEPETAEDTIGETEVETRVEEPETNKSEDAVDKLQSGTSKEVPETGEQESIEEQTVEQTLSAVEDEIIDQNEEILDEKVVEELIVQENASMVESEESAVVETEISDQNVEESLVQGIANIEMKENVTEESETHEPEELKVKDVAKRIEIGVVEPEIVKESKIIKVESPLEELSSSIEIAEEADEDICSPQLEIPILKSDIVAQKSVEPEKKDEDLNIPEVKNATKTEVSQLPENEIKDQIEFSSSEILVKEASEEMISDVQEKATESESGIVAFENVESECKDEAEQLEVPQQFANEIEGQTKTSSSEILAKQSSEDAISGLIEEVATRENVESECKDEDALPEVQQQPDNDKIDASSSVILAKESNEEAAHVVLPEIVPSGIVEPECKLEAAMAEVEDSIVSLDQIKIPDVSIGSISLPKLDEDVTDEDDSFLSNVPHSAKEVTSERSSEPEQPKIDHDDLTEPRRKPSEEPFKHFRSFVKEQIETSQKGLLGIQEFTPSLPSKTFASGIVISHAIPHQDKQVPTIPLEEPTLIEEPQVQVQIPEQNQDSDSGVSTDGTENINKSPRYELSPELKDAVPEEPEKSWTSWADESSEITKSVAEMVLNEPEEAVMETSKPLTYAVVAQKTPNLPVPTSSSSPRKSLFAIPTAQKSQKHSSKKSSQYRKPKPSQEKIEPVVDVAQKVKASQKKVVEKVSEEVKKPANIFEVLPEESPDESVNSSVTKKSTKSKKNPTNVASKTKLAPSANSSTSRVNIDDEDVHRDESDTLIADPNDNTGIAGAIANLSLESGTEKTETSPATSSAQDEYLRRQNWETGRIDYLGRDSFDNIWSKICETLDKKEPESAEPPETQTNNEAPNLVSTASIQLSRPQEEPRLIENLEITEYDPRGPVSLSMILNDQSSDQSSEVEYIETLPPDNAGIVNTDEDDIIFLKSADRHLYLSNIEEESPEDVKESSQEVPQVDGKVSGEGGGVGPERLGVLCTGVIESNNKEGLADVGNDFVVVDKEAVSQEQQGGTAAEQVKAAEQIAAEIVSEPEKVKLEAEEALQEKEEITPGDKEPEEIAQAKEEDVAKQVAEPEIVSEEQKVSEVVESAEVPAPKKVEEVVEVSQEKLSELQPLENKIEAVTETPTAAESNVILEEKKAESVVEAPVVTEPEIVSETQKEEELPPPVSNSELESLAASVPEAQKIEESSEPASTPVQESKVSEKEPEIKAVSETKVGAAPEITEEVEKVEKVAEPPSCLGSEPQSSEKEQIVEIVPEVPTSVVPEVAKDVQKLQEPAEAPTSSVLEARAIEKEEKIEIVPEVTQPETVPEKVQAEPEPVSKKEQADAVPEVVQTKNVAEVSQEASKAEERVEATSSPAITEPIAEVSAEPESKKEEQKDESSTVQESTTAELEQKAETVAQEPEIVQESQNLEVAAVAVVEEKEPESISKDKPLESLTPEEKKADTVVEGGVTIEEKLPEVQAAPEEPKAEGLVPESQSGPPEPATPQEEKTATGDNVQSEAAPAKVEVPEAQEQAKPESTTDVEEKKKAENLETTLPEKKLEINPNPGPSHNPGNPSESHNPGNPNPSGSNPGNPNGKQDKKGEKKGVITKILEFVGVAPKQKKSRDESGETSKSIFYDTEPEKSSESQSEPAKPSEAPPEPEKSENLTEEPARRLSIPHVPPTLIETSFVSAPVPSEDSPVPASSETIDEILKATDLSSISEQIPIVQSQQEDPTGEEVVQELIQIAEEASAKLAAEESSETIESLTGKLILLTDGLKELVEPEVKEEAGLSEEDTLEISKVVAETFEKIISVLEDPAAYIEEEKKRSPSPRVVIKEIEAIPETSVVSPTPPTSPEDVPKPKKEVKLLLVDETIPETPPVVEKDDVEKKTPIFLENNLIVDNQLIDTESLLSDINDIIDEAKNYVENQFSLECSTGEVNGEEEFEGLKVEGVKAGESVGATKEPENDEVGSKLDETMGETQPIEKKVQFDEEIRIVAVVESESSDGRAEQSEIGVIDSLESNEDRSLAIRERVAEIVEAERLDDASKKSEQGTIEEIHPDEESEIQTEKPETVETPQSTSQVITSEKSEEEVVEKITNIENTAQTDEEIKTEPPLIKSEPQTEDEFEEAVEELPEENLIISGTLVIDALGRNRDKTPEEPPKPPEKIQVKQPEEIAEPEEPVYSNVQKIDSKLVITTPPPPDTKFEVEEIKVTSEEERKKHKSQPSTSKLSGQILKAIPPPRRKAISEAKGIKSTGAIPKTKLDDSKIVSVVLEKPISESMSVDRTSTPPPVPPRRNKSKQRQPPLPPPKRKTKK